MHLDAEKLEYVYAWRLQQEHNLIKLKGAGMTDEQVVVFIDGCKWLLNHSATGHHPSFRAFTDTDNP